MKEIVMQDIIQAIAKELKILVPKANVYDEGLEQGYDEPCFFIDFVKENTNKMIGNRYNNIGFIGQVSVGFIFMKRMQDIKHIKYEMY